jgi:hypothetical protein
VRRRPAGRGQGLVVVDQQRRGVVTEDRDEVGALQRLQLGAEAIGEGQDALRAAVRALDDDVVGDVIQRARQVAPRSCLVEGEGGLARTVSGGDHQRAPAVERVTRCSVTDIQASSRPQ